MAYSICQKEYSVKLFNGLQNSLFEIKDLSAKMQYFKAVWMILPGS